AAEVGLAGAFDYFIGSWAYVPSLNLTVAQTRYSTAIASARKGDEFRRTHFTRNPHAYSRRSLTGANCALFHDSTQLRASRLRRRAQARTVRRRRARSPLSDGGGGRRVAARAVV